MQLICWYTFLNLHRTHWLIQDSLRWNASDRLFGNSEQCLWVLFHEFQEVLPLLFLLPLLLLIQSLICGWLFILNLTLRWLLQALSFCLLWSRRTAFFLDIIRAWVPPHFCFLLLLILLLSYGFLKHRQIDAQLAILPYWYSILTQCWLCLLITHRGPSTSLNLIFQLLDCCNNLLGLVSIN